MWLTLIYVTDEASDLNGLLQRSEFGSGAKLMSVLDRLLKLIEVERSGSMTTINLWY